MKFRTVKNNSKKILHLIDKDITDNSGEGDRESLSMNNICKYISHIIIKINFKRISLIIIWYVYTL